MRQRLVARAADIGKRWPELPVARKRAALTPLIERIEVSVDQIDECSAGTERRLDPVPIS